MKGIIQDTSLYNLVRALLNSDPGLPAPASPWWPRSYQATAYSAGNRTKAHSDDGQVEKELAQQPSNDTLGGVEFGIAEDVVGWYGPDDPEVFLISSWQEFATNLTNQNPRNFSPCIKGFICVQIFVLNSFLYLGSSIYSPGVSGVMNDLHASRVVATLGTSLSIIGYATGPMLLSPLSESPKVGRNLVYIGTLVFFVILQLPIALASNIEMVLIFRFLASFFGSPAMALGGATVNDIYLPLKRSYGLGLWELSTWIGPTLGPLVGGFAVQALGWRWTIWELVFVNGPMMLLVFCFLPETSASNILYRRAKRLRQMTGNERLRSETELRPLNVTGGGILHETIVRPWVLCFQEPICLLLHSYTSLICMLLFAWLESFPIVFKGIYDFNQGEVGLAFLGLLCGAIFATCMFVIWFRLTESKNFDNDCRRKPEMRFLPLMAGCWLIPISLFAFGWGASPHIHWIVPIMGSTLFSIGGFSLFVGPFLLCHGIE